MEDKPENILLEPRRALLEDGNGLNVMIVSGTPRIENEGREVIDFVVKVDDVVKKEYKLRRNIELDEQDNWKLTVAKIDVIPLNPYSETHRKWFYVKSFLHQATDMSKREEDLKTRLDAKDKRIRILESENIRLNEQLLLFRTNPAMAASIGAEVFKETGKVMADLMRPQPKGEQ